jgi:hypothetical protein
MRKKQRVANMADEVLARQARDYAKRTGESFEEALEAVLETEAGRQLGELRDGPHGDERAERWQEDLRQERAEERHEARGYVMDPHEDLQELLTRLNNLRDSMEEALGYVRGIEDDYQRGLLEAHITGAIREINEQIAELMSSR